MYHAKLPRVAALAAVLLASASAHAVVQNFDIGDSIFTATQAGTNPGVTFLGNAADAGGGLRLATVTGSQANGIAFNANAGVPSVLKVDFDFRIGGGNRADGMAFAYLNTANFGATGAGPVFSEQPDLAGSLGVGFDTFDNGEGSNNHVSFHANGAQLAQVNLNAAQINLAANVFHHYSSTITDLGGGNAQIVATLTDGTDGSVHVLLNTPVPGLSLYNGRGAFSARTGGAFDNHDIDNVVIQDNGITQASFNYNMTTAQLGAGPGPRLVNLGGVNQNALQLTSNVNSAFGVAAFDLDEPGVFDRVRASFDLRIANSQGGGADGIAFMLLNTANHGTTGVPGGLPVAIEDPNLAGAFSVGFDTFDNGGEGEASVSLHFNGAQVVSTPLNLSQIALENGAFNNVELLVDVVAGGSLVTLRMTDGTDGSVHTIYDNFFVAGLQPYEARVAFGARTGGANSEHFVDNINVALHIPEPTTALLLGLAGLMGLGRGRRNRAA